MRHAAPIHTNHASLGLQRVGYMIRVFKRLISTIGLRKGLLQHRQLCRLVDGILRFQDGDNPRTPNRQRVSIVGSFSPLNISIDAAHHELATRYWLSLSAKDSLRVSTSFIGEICLK